MIDALLLRFIFTTPAAGCGRPFGRPVSRLAETEKNLGVFLNVVSRDAGKD